MCMEIVNNLINENIFPLKVSSLRQNGDIWLKKTIYVKIRISQNKSFKIPVSI